MRTVQGCAARCGIARPCADVTEWRATACNVDLCVSFRELNTPVTRQVADLWNWPRQIRGARIRKLDNFLTIRRTICTGARQCIWRSCFTITNRWLTEAFISNFIQKMHWIYSWMQYRSIYNSQHLSVYIRFTRKPLNWFFSLCNWTLQLFISYLPLP